MIVQEKENAIKENAFAMMDFLVKIAVQNPVLEIAQEMETVEMEYACVKKDIPENIAKRLK